MMVQRRPSLSPAGPATAAPTKAPPVNTDTTAALGRSCELRGTMDRRLGPDKTHVSLSEGLNREMKDCEAIT